MENKAKYDVHLAKTTECLGWPNEAKIGCLSSSDFEGDDQRQDLGTALYWYLDGEKEIKRVDFYL